MIEEPIRFLFHYCFTPFWKYLLILFVTIIMTTMISIMTTDNAPPIPFLIVTSPTKLPAICTGSRGHTVHHQCVNGRICSQSIGKKYAEGAQDTGHQNRNPDSSPESPHTGAQKRGRFLPLLADPFKCGEQQERGQRYLEINIYQADTVGRIQIKIPPAPPARNFCRSVP